MCIIIYKPEGLTVTKRALQNCFTNNPDGAGFMFVAAGQVKIKKGYFKFKDFYQAYRTMEGSVKSDFILHFRIGTSGKLDANNCHPFKTRHNVGFVHNGVLMEMTDKTSDHSDTALFIQKILNPLPNNWQNSEAIKHLIEAYASDNASKFVTMDNKSNVHIYNETAGDWVDGLWFSNDGYLPATYSYRHWSRFDDDFSYNRKELESGNDTEVLVPCAICQCNVNSATATQGDTGEYYCLDCADYLWGMPCTQP